MFFASVFAGTLANGRSPRQWKCSYVRLAPRMLWFWRDTGGSCHATGAVAMVHGSCRLRWCGNLGVTTIAAGALHELPLLSVVMLVGGAAWIIFISLVSALVQKLAPEWVRARVLAVFLLAFQGGMAAGSALWGAVAEHAGIAIALMWAGLGSIATVALALRWRLPDTTMDVTPWNHWRMPAIVGDLALESESGPVLVTVEYVVNRERASEFEEPCIVCGRTRRRDGASQWGIFRDTEDSNRYLEMFLVNSWGEHLRQHERLTKADRELEERIRSYTLKEPTVRHLIYAAPQ